MFCDTGNTRCACGRDDTTGGQYLFVFISCVGGPQAIGLYPACTLYIFPVFEVDDNMVYAPFAIAEE